MRIKTILFTFACITSLFAYSQPGLIIITTQNNPDRSISFYANSAAYADYTLKLTFSTLQGYTSRDIHFSNIAVLVVKRGNAEVIKLTKDNSSNDPFMQYKYQYFPGLSFRRSADSTFEYLLPASAGNQVHVTTVSSTVSFLSQQLKNEYRGTGFSYKLSDTICASRAGIVYETSDTAMQEEKSETAYRRGRNRISIEHRDGTLGIYGITAPVKLLVSNGDEVFPGQPLAVFNKESERYLVYFSTCYLDEKKLLSDNTVDNTAYYIYMPTHFYGSETERSDLLQRNKEYKVQHPQDIIAAEMTKKEKKKFGFK